mmetsp:Transcript_27507/g.92584  ORF Transcript_27507/g.92584 Transcript_27507/m.92584 type:complete len:307 (+) Transcript_27507:216-1136(+)
MIHGHGGRGTAVTPPRGRFAHTGCRRGELPVGRERLHSVVLVEREEGGARQDARHPHADVRRDHRRREQDGELGRSGRRESEHERVRQRRASHGGERRRHEAHHPHGHQRRRHDGDEAVRDRRRSKEEREDDATGEAARACEGDGDQLRRAHLERSRARLPRRAHAHDRARAHRSREPRPHVAEGRAPAVQDRLQRALAPEEGLREVPTEHAHAEPDRALDEHVACAGAAPSPVHFARLLRWRDRPHRLPEGRDQKHEAAPDDRAADARAQRDRRQGPTGQRIADQAVCEVAADGRRGGEQRLGRD